MPTSPRALQALVVSALLVSLGSCDRSDPAAVLGDEVEEAHRAWEELGATDYRFEFVSYGVGHSGGGVVTVQDGCVVDAPDCGFTIDEIWRQILEARDRGDLHLASFYEDGVPKIVDFGDWDRDGGVHQSIHWFQLD